jgi:hypothetical protein
VRRRAFRFLVASAAGLGIWLATMATVPRGEYVSGARTTLLWLGMITMALALGYVFPDESDLVALRLVASPLLTAGWTAPRGDEDGLWVLFFPYLIFMGFVLLLVAWAASRLRTWLDGAAPGADEADH